MREREIESVCVCVTRTTSTDDKSMDACSDCSLISLLISESQAS